MYYLLTDLIYAWRAARRSPGTALSIIIMLALGTGGVTAVFYPVYSLISEPLPFPQPEQLVRIGDIPTLGIYNSIFEHREELDRIFVNMMAYTPASASMFQISETGKNRYKIRGQLVRGEFFETLGVRPIRGNTFCINDERFCIFISYRIWRDEFNFADDAIGKIIQIDNRLLNIAGILPENFDFPAGVDYWILGGELDELTNLRSTQFVGRLQPEISIIQAAIGLGVFKLGIAGKDGPILQSLKTSLYGDRTPLLFMLGTIAVLFLLLVCAGVMNLLVTQGLSRRSEMALRLVHGATRRNLICKLLREILPLVVVGALVGLWLSEIVNAWLRTQFPALMGGGIAVPVKMAYFASLVFAVTIIGGLTPALHITGVDLNAYLASGAVFKRRFFSLQEILSGIQLALALALLIGIGLLLHNLMLNFNIPIGWSPDEIAVVAVQFPPPPKLNLSDLNDSKREGELARRHAMFSQEFRHQLNTIPGVIAAGVLNPIPFSWEAELASQTKREVAYKNGPVDLGASATGINVMVSPEGFKILGIPLIAGRYFTEADARDQLERRISIGGILATKNLGFIDISTAAIINQSLARQFWPEENAIGKTLYGDFGAPYEVVGVIPDFYMGGKNKKIIPILFEPDAASWVSQRFLVRLNSGALIKDLRQRLSMLDTGSVDIEVMSLVDYASDPKANINLAFQFLGCFALMRIVVAGLGVYATTSLMAASRNKEIGIRMAMGAQTGDILLFVLWRGLRPIIIGLPVGLLLASILSRFLASLIVLNITNLPAWIFSCAVLVGIATIASFIPALRAIRVNPMDVLRKE